MATPAVAAVLNTIMADADLQVRTLPVSVSVFDFVSVLIHCPPPSPAAQAANGNALSPATAVQTLLCLAERNVVSGDLQGSPNRFLHIPRESFCVSGCGCGPCDDTKGAPAAALPSFFPLYLFFCIGHIGLCVSVILCVGGCVIRRFSSPVVCFQRSFAFMLWRCVCVL